MSQDKDDLLLVPVPALVAVLTKMERDKGAPLTEEEVVEARNNAACIAMPRDILNTIAEKRGYRDIEPEHAWEDWVAYTAARDAGELK